MNWSDYSYASNGSLMVVLIIILGALAAYLLLDRNTRTDKWSSKHDAWNGTDVEPEYNAGQDEYHFENGNPFDDAEVPSRLKKPKKKKKAVPKKRKPKKRLTKTKRKKK